MKANPNMMASVQEHLDSKTIKGDLWGECDGWRSWQFEAAYGTPADKGTTNTIVWAALIQQMAALNPAAMDVAITNYRAGNPPPGTASLPLGDEDDSTTAPKPVDIVPPYAPTEGYPSGATKDDGAARRGDAVSVVPNRATYGIVSTSEPVPGVIGVSVGVQPHDGVVWGDTLFGDDEEE